MALEEEERTRMKLRIASFGLLVVCAVLLLPTLARAESSALILSGVPGDEEHAKKFADWTAATRKALVDTFGFKADHVLVLADTKTSKADIQEAFTRLKQQLKPSDTFFLFFIGHGSYDTDYKFNIYHEDFTAAEYSNLIGTLNVGRVVIVNGTNASGGSIDALAGKNRVVVTATRSGSEGNDTLFYDYFLKALEDPAADEDKDKKLSVWEAFKYAAAGVDRFYKEQTRLSTEHALISDNGSPKVAADAKDVPVMARNTSFQVDRPVTSADSRVQALLNERLELELKISTLKVNKSSMSEAEYEKQLDDLQLQLALKNQQIKGQETK
jgi:hypothetical protein